MFGEGAKRLEVNQVLSFIYKKEKRKKLQLVPATHSPQMPGQGPSLLPESIGREEEVSGLTSGRITGCSGSCNSKLEPGGSREIGWAESLLMVGTLGSPLLSLPKEGEAKRGTEPLSSLHSTKSPGPWGSPKESESRNHKALSI